MTFGSGRSLGAALHIVEEGKELHEALEEGDLKKISSEIADIILLAVHSAHRDKIDLYQAVLDKFEIVKKRKWLPPDSEGVIRHAK